MKLTRNHLIVLSFFLSSLLLVSWDKLIKHPGSSLNKIQLINEDELSNIYTEDQFAALLMDNVPLGFGPYGNKNLPAAEDVLVQKIAGDNSHLLLMAFYNKEMYRAPFFTLHQNGIDILLKDDGIAEDAIAGDGLFTAKINTDVPSFRETAIRLDKQMHQNSFNYVQFKNRAIVNGADDIRGFDLKKFDAFQKVSIAGLNAAEPGVIDDIKSHSLFLTALSVVEDPTRTWDPCHKVGNPNGAWTFQQLMRQLATTNPKKPATDKQTSDFILKWLDNWSVPQVVNGDTIAARPLLARVLTNPWLERSLSAGYPKGQLDLSSAPFKLLGIVNRFDQRSIENGQPAGEARFVFTLLRSDCTDSKDYTLSFEYIINKPNNCDSIHAWAQQWYDLKNYTVGSTAYNAALEKITNQFTLSGTNRNNVNQSSLKHLRSNDQALTSNLTPIVGEFRQFVLSPVTHTFVLAPVENAAADRYNVKVDNADVRRFADYVNNNQKDIINNNLKIPVTYLDSPMLGGKTKIIGGIPVGEPPYPFHWDGVPDDRSSPAYIRNAEARHVISLNACSGCHAGETQTRFWHLNPVFYGKETTLSGFLTGTKGLDAIDFDYNDNNDSMTVKDPALRPSSNPKLYVYNDLLRRAEDLNDFLSQSCGSIFSIRNQLMYKPMVMVH